MRDKKGNSFTSKEDILTHIVATYKAMDEGTDSAAKEFFDESKMTPKDVQKIEKAHQRNFHKMQKEIQKEEHREQEQGKTRRNLITLKNLEKCMATLQNKKASGPDNIASECIKHLTAPAKRALLRLLNLMLEQGHTPTAWKNAETKLIHKKDDTSDIANYRPITLLNTLFKLWEKVLDRATRDQLEGDFPNQLQMGSQAANSATMTIAASKAIMQTAVEHGKQVYTASIDMNKAYNRVNRNRLWTILRKMGVPDYLLTAIMSTYENASDTICVGQSTSKPFHLKNGLRQGSALSPLLYILYTSELIDELQNTNTGITLKCEGKTIKISCLMFVDDLTTYATSCAELAMQLDIIQLYAKKSGGVMNKKKSSVSATVGSEQLKTEMASQNIKIQQKKEFVHLGAKHNLHELSSKGNAPMTKSTDVTHRLGIARGVLITMIRNGLREGAIQIGAAKHIVNAVILQKLTHGLSYAYTTKQDEWGMEKMMADAARSIFGVDEKRQISDKWIIRDTGMTNPLDIIKINDLKLILAAMKDKINTTVRGIILDSACKLDIRSERTCSAWGITIEELLPIEEKKLNKYLLQKATEKPMHLIQEYMQLVSESELKINQIQPTYVTAGVSSKMLATYLETRAGLHGGNKGEQTLCPYCPNEPLHTYTHCINECSYGKLTRCRTDHQEIWADQGLYLPIATISSLTAAMTTDNHQDLQFYLNMIHSSPYL
jgi:hypothetical protein